MSCGNLVAFLSGLDCVCAHTAWRRHVGCRDCCRWNQGVWSDNYCTKAALVAGCCLTDELGVHVFVVTDGRVQLRVLDTENAIMTRFFVLGQRIIQPCLEERIAKSVGSPVDSNTSVITIRCSTSRDCILTLNLHDTQQRYSRRSKRREMRRTHRSRTQLTACVRRYCSAMTLAAPC